MKQKLLSLFKKQAGFMLIDFMVGLAIMGLLGTGIMAITSGTITQNVRSRSQMQAVQQVENVGQWVTNDVQMSKTVAPGVGSGFPLLLNWSDYAGNTYQVTYSIVGTKLKRSYVKNGGTAEETFLADSLNTGSTHTNCSYAGEYSNYQNYFHRRRVHETRTYQIKIEWDN